MNATSTRFTVCSIQPATCWEQPDATFTSIRRLAQEACQLNEPDLLILPEHFNAAPEEGKETGQREASQRFASQLARDLAVNLVAGSVEHWDDAAGGRVNTAVVYDRWGKPLGTYQKRQLFGFEKRRGVLAGSFPLTVELDGVRCGILICADLWFPELVREMAGQIDLLCVPAQTTIRPESEPAYARMLWHNLAMTRAQENVLAVVVSDHAATSQAPFRCGGVSSVVDPSAEPDLAKIQQVVDGGEAGFVAGTLDLERLRRFRVYRRENGLLRQLPGGNDEGYQLR